MPTTMRACTLPRTPAAARAVRRAARRGVFCQAQPTKTKPAEKPEVGEDPAAVGGLGKLQVGSLGDLLGPIGITIGKDVHLKKVGPRVGRGRK